MSRARILLAILAVSAGPLTAEAEQRYVADKLVLNVYATAEPGSEKIAIIETGDAVEALERVGNLTFVRLDDGREGWVGSNYLSADPPAAVLLRELQSQQRSATAPPAQSASTEEMDLLRKQNAALQGEVGNLQQKITELVAAAAEAPAAETPAVQPSVAGMTPVATSGVTLNFGFHWLWAALLSALLSLALGGAGFALGYQSLARRLRRKFGALKIY